MSPNVPEGPAENDSQVKSVSAGDTQASISATNTAQSLCLQKHFNH
jgi:hypothetical protein